MLSDNEIRLLIKASDLCNELGDDVTSAGIILMLVDILKIPEEKIIQKYCKVKENKC